MAQRDVLNHWETYYDGLNVEQAPSRFATFVADRFVHRRAAIDVGCGAGRDSFLFASKGWTVIGLDASGNAIARAQDRCAQFGDRCEFLTFDVDNGDLATLPGVQKLPLTETIVYARFFLHAIPQPSAEAFLRSAAKLVAAGACLCIECRTDEDEALPKVERPHYRRFVVPADLIKQCAALGMENDFIRIGRGLAPYGTEDPVVVRAFFAAVR